MMQVGEKGELIAVEHVRESETMEVSCPLGTNVEDKMAMLDINGSSIKCRMECPLRRKEG